MLFKIGFFTKLGELYEPMQTCNRFEPHEKKTPLLRVFLWGGQWDSNPRISEPQSEALTAWRCPPFVFQLYNKHLFFSTVKKIKKRA